METLASPAPAPARRRRARRLPALVALVVAAATPALLAGAAEPAAAASARASVSAGIWTPIASGLGAGDTIRAIDYQSPTRMWLATTTGKVATRQPNGSFTVVSVSSPANALNDVAFKPGATIGVAVGNNGYIERTTDGGATWIRINFSEPTANTQSDSYRCGAYNTGSGDTVLNTTPNPAVPLYSVHWGTGGTVLVTGSEGTVLRSTNDGASFTEINRFVRPYSSTDPDQTIGCRLQNGDTDDVFDAQFASTTSNDEIYFQIDGGPVYYTNTGLAAGSTPIQTSDIGCGGEFGRLAVNPANPANQWAATDRGTTTPCFYLTSSASASNFENATVPNSTDVTLHASEDVVAVGTGTPTVVTVGRGGDILNSVDGRTFYVNKLSTTDTTDWYSVSGSSNNDVAVGGANGKLLITNRATTLPLDPPVVTPPPPVTPPASTSTKSVGGGTVSLAGPTSCVKAGSTFKAKVKAKKVGLAKVTVSVDGKKKGTRKSPPFKVKVKTKGLAPGVHTLTSKVTVKLGRGKKASASLSSTFTVC